jgi:hypothetical protein
MLEPTQRSLSLFPPSVIGKVEGVVRNAYAQLISRHRWVTATRQPLPQSLSMMEQFLADVAARVQFGGQLAKMACTSPPLTQRGPRQGVTFAAPPPLVPEAVVLMASILDGFRSVSPPPGLETPASRRSVLAAHTGMYGFAFQAGMRDPLSPSMARAVMVVLQQFGPDIHAARGPTMVPVHNVRKLVEEMLLRFPGDRKLSLGGAWLLAVLWDIQKRRILATRPQTSAGPALRPGDKYLLQSACRIGALLNKVRRVLPAAHLRAFVCWPVAHFLHACATHALLVFVFPFSACFCVSSGCKVANTKGARVELHRGAEQNVGS